jgi:hypothetical protein
MFNYDDCNFKVLRPTAQWASGAILTENPVRMSVN